MAAAKELYRTGAPYKDVLRALPRGATKERMVFKGLDRYGKDYKRAFEQIPHSYRTFWIHAFQSHIWNACAMFRLQCYGPKPVAGDLYLDPSAAGQAAPRVLQAEDIPNDDEAAARSMMQRIVLPLGGKNVLLPVSDVGQRYVNLLAEYGLRIPFVNADQLAAPEVANALTTVPDSVMPKGAYRTLLSFPEDLHARVIGENEEGIDAELTFTLPAGSYATSLLREAFCNNDIWLA
jgi:tRNA(Glu) U13 pseudouridine synthase TruD